MKNIVIGFTIGFLVGGGITWAALPPDTFSREQQKFVADSNGDVAIRAVVVTQ